VLKEESITDGGNNMKINFKNALLISSMTFGALALPSIMNAQSASAKSYAKVTLNRSMVTPASSRNVNVTGNNGLYSKIGTTKGAKLLASPSRLADLKSSNLGQDNWRAYRIATTDRGAVYYKIVSFDGSYRGWVYGGTSTYRFNGGLASFATTGTYNDGKADNKTVYKLTGLAAGENNVLYKAPAWTQYKVGRAKVNGVGSIIVDETAYKNATFTLGGSAENSRSHEVWYQISNSSNADINGAWVQASNLVAAPTTATPNPTTPSTPTPAPSVQAVKTATFDTSSNGGNGQTVPSSTGDVLKSDNADIASGNGARHSYVDAQSKFISDFKVAKGTPVTNDNVKTALANEGLTDFYAVNHYSFLTKDQALPAKSIQMWHYEYSGVTITGNSADNINVEIHYNVTKYEGDPSSMSQGATWKQIFTYLQSHPEADKPAGDKPAGDKPAGDNPTGDKPAGDNPTGDKPAGDKPAGDNPAGDKPAGDKPAGDNPAGDKPADDKPAGDNPTGDNPTGTPSSSSNKTISAIAEGITDVVSAAGALAGGLAGLFK